VSCWLAPQVLRPLQHLSRDVAQQSPPLDEWRSFIYCTSMTGRILGEVDHFKGMTAVPRQVVPMSGAYYQNKNFGLAIHDSCPCCSCLVRL
jgi:hypothetical protein